MRFEVWFTRGWGIHPTSNALVPFTSVSTKITRLVAEVGLYLLLASVDGVQAPVKAKISNAHFQGKEEKLV